MPISFLSPAESDAAALWRWAMISDGPAMHAESEVTVVDCQRAEPAALRKTR